MESKSKRIALYGVFAALIVVVFYLETLIGSFWITPPAIVSLSLLFTFCLSADWRLGLGGGILFGLTSWALAAMFGNPAFIFPWISVLPRAFVGIGAYGGFRLTKRLVKDKANYFVTECLPYSIGALCGIVINTALVVTALTLFLPEMGSLGDWLSACITINFPIELIAAVILTPVLSNALKRAFGKKAVKVEKAVKSDESKSDIASETGDSRKS